MLQIGTEIRYRLRDILAKHWPAFFENHTGWIRPAVLENVRRVLACRTPALGCHAYECPCGMTKIVPHSCKSRLCSICNKIATDRWASGVLNNLLDVPYHHVILSVPGDLRATIAYNREVGLNLVLEAAIGCLNQWSHDQHGMKMGMVAVLHTFGSDLRWHPHVHLLVTEGGLSVDGQRWVQPYKEGWLMRHSGLKKMWRYHCVSAFRKAHKAGELRFPAKQSRLKKYSVFNGLLSKVYKKTWYAHIGKSLRDAKNTVHYIGRYTKRAVLAEYRITYCDDKKVRFAFKDYAKGGRTSFKTLPVFAFIRRLIRHIPDKDFKMVRYGGIFATRWKAQYLPQARAALATITAGTGYSRRAPQNRSQQNALLPWRERRMAESGEDPLICPKCQIPMRFVGVIFGPHAKIADYFTASGTPTSPTHPAWDTS